MAVESLIGLATLAVIMLLVVWCADKHRSEYIGKPLIFLYFPWVDGHEAGVAPLTHALSIISAKRLSPTTTPCCVAVRIKFQAGSSTSLANKSR